MWDGEELSTESTAARFQCWWIWISADRYHGDMFRCSTCSTKTWSDQTIQTSWVHGNMPSRQIQAFCLADFRIWWKVTKKMELKRTQSNDSNAATWLLNDAVLESHFNAASSGIRSSKEKNNRENIFLYVVFWQPFICPIYPLWKVKSNQIMSNQQRFVHFYHFFQASWQVENVAKHLQIEDFGGVGIIHLINSVQAKPFRLLPCWLSSCRTGCVPESSMVSPQLAGNCPPPNTWVAPNCLFDSVYKQHLRTIQQNGVHKFHFSSKNP